MEKKEIQKKIDDLKEMIDSVNLDEATPKQLAEYLINVEKFSTLMALAVSN